MSESDNKQEVETRGAADHDESPAPNAAEEGTAGRREFLTRSGALLALLGAAGVLHTDALGQETVRPAGQDTIRTTPDYLKARRLDQKQLKNLQGVLQEAISKRDTSVLQRNTGLPNEVVAALARLTKEDLEDAARIHNKLSDLQDKLSDNNGVIGM